MSSVGLPVSLGRQVFLETCSTPVTAVEGCALELFVARHHSIFVKPCCKREGALALLLGRSFGGGESELVGFDWDRK
jgi:hypothetical protein